MRPTSPLMLDCWDWIEVVCAPTVDVTVSMREASAESALARAVASFVIAPVLPLVVAVTLSIRVPRAPSALMRADCSEVTAAAVVAMVALSVACHADPSQTFRALPLPVSYHWSPVKYAVGVAAWRNVRILEDVASTVVSRLAAAVSAVVLAVASSVTRPLRLAMAVLEFAST